MVTTPFFGESCALGAAFVWAFTLFGFAKHGRQVPAIELNLFKNCTAFLCFVAVLLVIGRPLQLDFASLGWLGLSGILGIAIGDTFLFASLKYLSAPLTAAIQCTSPFFAAVGAFFFLGEHLTFLQICGGTLTTVAVCAAILSSRKSQITAVNTRGVVFAVLSSAANASGMILTRAHAPGLDSALATLARVGAAAVLLTAMVVVAGRRQPSAFAAKWSKHLVGRLAVLSVFSACIGIWLTTIAAQHTKAAIVTSLSMTYPIWIIPIAWWLHGERTSVESSACVSLATIGVILLIL